MIGNNRYAVNLLEDGNFVTLRLKDDQPTEICHFDFSNAHLSEKQKYGYQWAYMSHFEPQKKHPDVIPTHL